MLTVFAGTFNPIHIAHLIIAEAVRCDLNCEKVLFIPSFIPPCKNGETVSAEHRLNMVRLAVESNPYFEVSDIEFKLGGTSYTFNTISELYRQNPDIEGKINFIIGSDAFKSVTTWHKYEELEKLVNFVVIQREIQISSSYIRERIKENKSVKYLVPDAVEKYIIENKLYLF